MKKILVILLCLISYLSQAQDSITISPDFVINKKVKLTISKKKNKLKASEMHEAELNTKAVFVVLSKNDSGYVAQWQYSKIVSKGEESVYVQGMNSLLDKLKFQVLIKKNGEFQKLLDWKLVKVDLDKKINKLASTYQDPKVQKQIKGLVDLLKDEEAVQTAVSKDLQLYLSANGLKVPVKDSMLIRSTIPNVMGGLQIPAYLSMNYLKQNDNIIFTTKLTVNEVLGKDIIEDMLKRYYQLKKMQINADNMLKFDFLDFKENIYKANNLEKIIFKRKIQYADVSQVETDVIVVEK